MARIPRAVRFVVLGIAAGDPRCGKYHPHQIGAVRTLVNIGLRLPHRASNALHNRTDLATRALAMVAVVGTEGRTSEMGVLGPADAKLDNRGGDVFSDHRPRDLDRPSAAVDNSNSRNLCTRGNIVRSRHDRGSGFALDC